jgi:hypothetical protein
MQRRNFLKLVSAAGICTAAPTLVTTTLADGHTYGGPYWVFVTASGGWDPRFMFDPTLNGIQNRIYTQIGTIGAINYAPIAIDQEALGLGIDNDFSPYLLSNEQFLQRFGARLLVLNGIDTGTNNHDTGQRAALSGVNPEGYPAIGALLAATHGPTKPVTFMSSGGYDTTAGLVPLARMTDPDAIRNLAAPNLIDPKNPETDSFHTADTWARIRTLQRDRLAGLKAKQRLPRHLRSMERLEVARSTDDLLAGLHIPEQLAEIPSFQIDDVERFMRQAQLAIAGFSSGLAVSASLQFGGFDTHSDHNRNQVRQIVKLWGGLAYLLDQLDAAGIGGNTYVVVASDFGRGPHYNGENDNAGKDHWPITSMLLMGPGIVGNRVVGATDDGQLPALVDPGSLQVAPEGVKLTPTLIHRSLRQLAGIAPELQEQYPLLGDPVALFG